MSHQIPWKSPTLQVNPGAPMEIIDPAPIKGPNGGRIVIDRAIVCVQGTITVGTAAWDGRDVPKIIGSAVVEQRDGRQRWNLSGCKTRFASIYFNGIESHQEHGNVAVGAAQTVDLRLIIPFAKPYIVRGKDFALPADCLKKFILNFAQVASAQTGTTVLSAPALVAYVLLEWHEEFSVEFKCEDVVKSIDFTSATQARMTPIGAVHDVLLCKESTTSGGDVVTAITDVRCEDLSTPLLTRADLVHSYTVKRKIAPSGPTTPATERFLDPVREGKLLPFVCADYDTSVWDGKVLENLKIDLTAGVAGLSIISREIVEKSQSLFNATVARFKVDTRTLRMKTDAKTKRGLGDGWTRRQIMTGPWSAPLNMAA